MEKNFQADVFNSQLTEKGSDSVYLGGEIHNRSFSHLFMISAFDKTGSSP